MYVRDVRREGRGRGEREEEAHVTAQTEGGRAAIGKRRLRPMVAQDQGGPSSSHSAKSMMQQLCRISLVGRCQDDVDSLECVVWCMRICSRPGTSRPRTGLAGLATT